MTRSVETSIPLLYRRWEANEGRSYREIDVRRKTDASISI